MTREICSNSLMDITNLNIGDCDQSTQLITCSNIRIESSPAAVAMASVTGDLIKEKYLRNVDYKLN